MSVLLEDIINLAIDGKQPLPDLLRKCLLLGHELHNERLKVWATQELNGYDSAEGLPKYRIVHGSAKGNFIGPHHAQYRGHIIPPAVLQEKHRVLAETLYLTQSVSAYAALSDDATVLVYAWPPDMVAYYAAKLMQNGFICHEAWQELPANVVVEVLDTVRNLTLKMALEIKDELGTSYTDLRKIESNEAARIQTIIFQNTGGNTTVAFGQASVDASTHSQNIFAVGDRQTLELILGNAGLEKTDLHKLNEAIQEDGDKKLGARIGNWIKEQAPKVIVGGVKIGAKVGQEILTECLMQYLGLK
jgi:hypothetical protein